MAPLRAINETSCRPRAKEQLRFIDGRVGEVEVVDVFCQRQFGDAEPGSGWTGPVSRRSPTAGVQRGQAGSECTRLPVLVDAGTIRSGERVGGEAVKSYPIILGSG